MVARAEQIAGAHGERGAGNGRRARRGRRQRGPRRRHELGQPGVDELGFREGPPQGRQHGGKVPLRRGSGRTRCSAARRGLRATGVTFA